MRVLTSSVLIVLGLTALLLIGVSTAHADGHEDVLTELNDAGVPFNPPLDDPDDRPPDIPVDFPLPIPLPNPADLIPRPSDLIPGPSDLLPGPPGPIPGPLDILPVPNPIDLLPSPTDLLPGSLNPFNWAGDLVNAVFTTIGQALLEAIRGFVDWALGLGGSSLNFVTHTPAEGTYESPTVRSLYDFSRAIVNLALAVIVMWGGFNVIVKEHIRSPYHEGMELLPRVILAALAANLSIEFARLLIDLNNAITAAIGQVGLPGYDEATPTQEGIALIFTAVAYGIVAVLLVFQMLMRLALLAMLIVLGPIAALLWVLPQTQQWARWWVDLFTITVFQQAVQVMVLALGTALMVELTPGSVSNALLTMLLGLAVCWLTLKVPSLLRSARSQAGITNVLTFAVATHALGAMAGAGRGAATAAASGAGRGATTPTPTPTPGRA